MRSCMPHALGVTLKTQGLSRNPFTPRRFTKREFEGAVRRSQSIRQDVESTSKTSVRPTSALLRSIIFAGPLSSPTRTGSPRAKKPSNSGVSNPYVLVSQFMMHMASLRGKPTQKLSPTPYPFLGLPSAPSEIYGLDASLTTHGLYVDAVGQNTHSARWPPDPRPARRNPCAVWSAP